MSQPVPRQSLTDKVFQHLEAKLAGRELSIGDRINSRQIATELSVSRSTVNKAIDRLSQSGWIKYDDSRHPVVAALPARIKVLDSPQFAFSNQTESTYELLLDRILRAEFGPGEIVKERPLAMQIGVNPATIRRAAEWLRNDGLLERLPRRGWRVTLLSPRDMKDAYEIRLLLEPSAVAAAVHQIREEELDELDGQTARLIELGERATVYDRREADLRFHSSLCRASGNVILAETLEPVISKLLLITTVGFRYGRSARSFEEHREIIHNIRERDEKQAVKRIKAHLRNAMKFNAEVWERQQF